jgi:glycosyltransferase involved in cell wall biosynthesis
VCNNREYSSIQRRRLKILFVGGLSQRKGLAYIFEAAAQLKDHVELTIVGHKVNDRCPVLDKELNAHKWISSLPHNEILKLMRQHDLLVFPSLFEGFGLVITEAMSQGTPVITTDRTAGPDLINHEQNGWIINAGSTEALVAAIENVLVNYSSVEDVGRAAVETALSRPWNCYAQELVKEVLKD